MNIDLNNTIDKFVVQLNSIEKMVEEVYVEKKEEKVEELELSDIVFPIFNRKFDEYYVKHNIEEYMLDENERKNLYNFTDMLIEKNMISKKLYNSCEVYEDESGDVRLHSDNPGILFYIMEKIKQSEKKDLQNREALIYQSAVINICICLETLVSEIVKDFYLNIHRGNLIENKSLTFKQLSEFGDINDARMYLIDAELDSKFRKNFLTWFTFIKEKFHMSDILKDKKEIIESICELYQRRNLFVHADGYINDYYLKNVSVRYKKHINKGERITADYNYVMKRIKQVEELGWIIYYKYSLIVHRNDYTNMFNAMNDVLLKHMKRNCDAIPMLYKKMHNNENLNTHCRLVAEVNYYLYYRMNNRIDEVRAEYESKDHSMLSNEYIMAKAIILDEGDAFEKTKSYIDSIDDEEFLFVCEWPLLRIVKQDSPYREFFIERLNQIFSTEGQEVSYEHN